MLNATIDSKNQKPLAMQVSSPAASRRAPLQQSSFNAYAKDLRLYLAWGGKVPADAALLQKFIHVMGKKLKPTTLRRRLMAIRHAHVSQGLPSPTQDPAIRSLLRWLQLGYPPSKIPRDSAVPSPTRPRRHEQKSAKPLTRSMLLRMLDAMHRSSLDRRDRALLLLGFMGALKRAELVSLNVSDLSFTADAVLVRLKGRQLAIPATGGELCAATAVKQWLEHAALDLEPADSPSFRSFDRGGNPTSARLDSAWISVVVKNRLQAVGIDPAPYSAQSLRTGRLLESSKGVL